MTYLRENGAPIVKTYTVPTTTRFTIDVRPMVPELQDESFGAWIEVTNGVTITVERSMYWDANGVFWAAGTNARHEAAIAVAFVASSKQAKREDRDERRDERAQSRPSGTIAPPKKREQRLAGGIRRVGDHRQPAAGDRALDHRDLQRSLRFGTSVAR